VRVAVLPREVAARVITSATARGAWAINAASLALTVPLLIEYMLVRGLASELPLPLTILIGLLLLAIAAGLVPKPWVVACFLAIGAGGAILYELTLLAAHPAIHVDGFFLLNRPAVSLVLIGVGATTWRIGITWTVVGFLVSLGVSGVVAAASGLPFKTGWGPFFMLGLYVVGYLTFAGIQASQRRRLPNLEQLEAETRRLGVEENLRERVTATVHDTLLNDLSIVMNGPDDLDDRVRDRLRSDITTLTSAEWLKESAAVAVLDDQDSELRNQIMNMMTDVQWRGLTVHITGSGTGIYRLAPEAATALVEAIRACFENVLSHSGTTVVELDLAYTENEITAIVADQGVGFVPDSVAADRLGLTHSVVGRVEAVGGSVRIWSAPGSGTSIVMRVPVVEVLIPHEESTHGRA
jgi:signal transduction histidine kinase